MKSRFDIIKEWTEKNFKWFIENNEKIDIDDIIAITHDKVCNLFVELNTLEDVTERCDITIYNEKFSKDEYVKHLKKLIFELSRENSRMRNKLSYRIERVIKNCIKFIKRKINDN